MDDCLKEPTVLSSLFPNGPSSGVIHIMVADSEGMFYSAFPLYIADFMSVLERVEGLGDPLYFKHKKLRKGADFVNIPCAIVFFMLTPRPRRAPRCITPFFFSIGHHCSSPQDTRTTRRYQGSYPSWSPWCSSCSNFQPCSRDLTTASG